jgi:putative ABC transport system substrate-binding protein
MTPKFPHESAAQAMRAQQMFGPMNRRNAIKALVVAAAWPLAARAQTRPVLGFLASGEPKTLSTSMAGFLGGLKESGFVDGQNLTIEYRWAEGRFERLSALADELVRRPVDVLFAAQGTVSALAAKRATSTIPIVFVTADDPVAAGLVASLSRPGGNLTGISRLGTALIGKNIELVHQIVPSASTVGVLVNPQRPTAQAQRQNAQVAATAIGKTVKVLHANSEAEIEAAFKAMVSERIGALVVPVDSVFNIHRKQIIASAERDGIPTAYALSEFIADGGLMSYGDSSTESYKLASSHVARILKGAKPADLPVQQASKLELTLNLKAAKALGLNIPITVLGRADEVIE